MAFTSNEKQELVEHSCMNCTKRDCSLLSQLSFKELELLNLDRYMLQFKKGETICKVGTKPIGLICLKDGKVKVTKQGVNGEEQIVSLKKPVDFIGFRALMSHSVCSESSIALVDSSVCIIRKDDFFKTISSNSDLAFKIITWFAEELGDTETRLVNLTQKHLQSRLAEALLLVHQVYGLNEKDGHLGVALKRSDLAALSNMTISNVSRVLTLFVKEHLVETHQRHIKLLNVKALKEISLQGS